MAGGGRATLRRWSGSSPGTTVGRGGVLCDLMAPTGLLTLKCVRGSRLTGCCAGELSRGAGAEGSRWNLESRRPPDCPRLGGVSVILCLVVFEVRDMQAAQWGSNEEAVSRGPVVTLRPRGLGSRKVVPPESCRPAGGSCSINATRDGALSGALTGCALPLPQEGDIQGFIAKSFTPPPVRRLEQTSGSAFG